MKEEAFICGVVYAGLMRDVGQERDFDESTVVRDIERVMRIRRKVGTHERASAVERLRELEAVREAGLITEAEYEEKREEIIAGI